MVKFGVQLQQEDFDFEGLMRACREVEDLGYDSAWIYDHFYPMSTKARRNVFDAWTLLPAFATETRRLRLGVLVTCNSYRYPSVLAKIAATTDVISGGRLEFGIGAGWYKEEYEAYGVPFPDARTRIEQLDEAVELIKRIWTQERANFKGKHYAIKDLVSHPKPVQKPHPPIWIGGKGDRLLRTAAKHADNANFALCSVEEFREKLETLKRHCLDVGRRFEDVEKTWCSQIIIAEKEEEAKRKALMKKEHSNIEKMRRMSFEDFLNKTVAGTPEQCVERIQEYVDLGVTYFILCFPFDSDLKAVRGFKEKVAPAFK